MHYKKIYINEYGPLPRDSNGRIFEVHHIDGNSSNNHIANLKAVSIQEHYDIHYKQEDWNACKLIALRLKKSKEEISELASKANLKRVAAGTNPFVGPTMNQTMIDNGTHPWLGGEQSRKNANKLVAEGKHPFSGGIIQSESNKKRIENKTHNWLGNEVQMKQLAEGTHNFQKKKKCSYCEYVGNPGNVAVHIRKKHNDN